MPTYRNRRPEFAHHPRSTMLRRYPLVRMQQLLLLLPYDGQPVLCELPNVLGRQRTAAPMRRVLLRSLPSIHWFQDRSLLGICSSFFIVVGSHTVERWVEVGAFWVHAFVSLFE